MRALMRWAALILAGGVLSLLSAAPAVAADVSVRTLSNRADLVSGGDVLVEVTPAASGIRVTAGGRDVTSQLHRGPDGRLIGVVSRLPNGSTDLAARLPDGRGAVLTVHNHPLTGPVFSGPQTQPWTCDTEGQGLGPSKPPFCMAPTQVAYFYRSTDPTKSGWQTYDPKHPPADVAKTTTDDGRSVPFVVRQEIGTMNRSIYAFAALWDPAHDAPAWNRKLFYDFGGGAAPSHHQGLITTIKAGSDGDRVGPEVSTDFPAVLARGYATATASLDRGEYNVNDVTAAETMMMVKERLIEQLGEVRFTMGWGCSGGSINQNLISGAYPGLLDGIQPSCNAGDWYSTGMDSMDCHLLENYFTNVSPHLWANVAQRDAVEGQGLPSSCQTYELLTTRYWWDPGYGCFPHLVGSDSPWVYNAQTNPTGVRCTLMDDQVAIFGHRPRERWGPIERKIGRGFAPRPLDNVGVQYGLAPLLAGLITPEQFVDLNEKVGGVDLDYNYTPQRMVADPEALQIVYRTGRVPVGNTWADAAIIDLGSNGNYDVHADVRSHIMRARLMQANGSAANQVIWKHAGGEQPFDLAGMPESLDVMNRWLTAIKADKRDLPLAQKVIRDKPADAVDRCDAGTTELSRDNGVCRTLFPYAASARIAAGGPPTNDVMKCRLRPLSIDDYNGAVPPMTTAQFERLKKVFPNGVCDWSKPGVGYQPNVPWMTFTGGPGGRPLGPAPRSREVDR